MMDDFSTPGQANTYGLAPSAANFIAPGKRPLSSMSPSIVVRESDGAMVVVGASGGPRIITATLQALVRLLLRGRSPFDAIHLPRLHDQLLPDECRAEESTLHDGTLLRVSRARREALARRGHHVVNTSSVGVAQLVVRRENGELHAVSDRRKGGRPADF